MTASEIVLAKLQDLLQCFKITTIGSKKEEKKPQISLVELNRHVQALSAILSQPWSYKVHLKKLTSQLVSLVEVMRKYCRYLQKTQ